MRKGTVVLALGRSERQACEINGWHAGSLLVMGTAEHVIFCGKQSWLWRGTAHATEAQVMLAAAGPLPAGSYSLDIDSTCTITNMVAAKRIVETGGWRHVVIVCIPYAGWRARYAARMVFGKKYTIKVRTSPYHFPGGWRERMRTLVKEILGFALTWRSLSGITPGDAAEAMRWWRALQRHYLAHWHK